MKKNTTLKSPVDNIIIDLILDHFNIQSVNGQRESLTGIDFQKICDHAEQIYFDNVMITTSEHGEA